MKYKENTSIKKLVALYPKFKYNWVPWISTCPIQQHQVRGYCNCPGGRWWAEGRFTLEKGKQWLLTSCGAEGENMREPRVPLERECWGKWLSREAWLGRACGPTDWGPGPLEQTAAPGQEVLAATCGRGSGQLEVGASASQEGVWVWGRCEVKWWHLWQEPLWGPLLTPWSLRPLGYWSLGHDLRVAVEAEMKCLRSGTREARKAISQLGTLTQGSALLVGAVNLL